MSKKRTETGEDREVLRDRSRKRERKSSGEGLRERVKRAREFKGKQTKKKQN